MTTLSYGAAECGTWKTSLLWREAPWKPRRFGKVFLPAVCFKTARDAAKGEDRDSNRHQSLTPALCIAQQRSTSRRWACSRINPILEELIFAKTAPAPSSYAWRGVPGSWQRFVNENPFQTPHEARGGSYLLPQPSSLAPQPGRAPAGGTRG